VRAKRFLAVVAAVIGAAVLIPATAATAATVTVERRVGASGGDAEEAQDGRMSATSSDLELVDDSSPFFNQKVGLHFADLDIPQGVSITAAWIQFQVDEATNGAADVTFRAQASNDAAPYVVTFQGISSRPVTTAAASWQPEPWSLVGQAGAAQRTPDLSSLVQEVVNRPGWAPNNDLGFTITGTGRRVAESYNGSQSGAPLLHVKYSTDTEPPPPPPPVGTVTFAVIGDFGQVRASTATVASTVAQLDPDFVVTVGDNNYTSSSDLDNVIGRYYSAYIGDYQGSFGPGSPTNRFFPSLGNHDYSDGGGLPAYEAYFTLPGTGVVTSGTSGNERYYDFTMGPVQFFVVNSNSQEPDGNNSTSDQADWLQAGLAASTAPWQIVLFHHAPYSSGEHHGSDTTMQWPFAAWGADAVLAGHEHIYERLAVDGIPYFINGVGGADLHAASPPIPESRFVYDDDFGTMLVEVCEGRLAFTFHSISEGVVDALAVGAASCAVG
jgi:hypothetical protein